AVEVALARLRETKFIGMEHFGSRTEDTREVSLLEVGPADLYVGVIGGRYGSGITEDEYRRALELKLHCFLYFKDEAAIGPGTRAPSGAARPSWPTWTAGWTTRTRRATCCWRRRRVGASRPCWSAGRRAC